jgi:choline-sulfatase
MRPYISWRGAAVETLRCFTLGRVLTALVTVLLSVTFSLADDRPPNVVIIVVDALRPDHLGCYGYGRPTSPHIDEIAASGVRFETAITQAPWTKGSFSTILTSRYPFQHGVTNWSAVMPDTLVTLPEILASKGYHTMFVINMIGMTGRFGVLRGFDEVSEAEKYERNAVQTTEDATAMMQAAPEPYFLIIHYYDAHAPYHPPMAYVDRVSGDLDVNKLIQDGRGDSDAARKARTEKKILFYDGCIRYVDDEIARLVEFLRESGTYDNTVLVVIADHGEALGDRDIFGHGAEAYDDVAKVPLVLGWPARFSGGRTVKEQVRLFDLHPTVLEIAGIDDYPPGEAVSLLPLLENGVREAAPGSFLPADVAMCDCTNREVPGKIALRTSQWKLIIEPLTQLVELYNLKDDPGETVNVWGGGVPMGDSLLALVSRVPASHPEGWRVALTSGETGRDFAARVGLASGARFRSVGRLARIEKNLSVTLADDSTSFDLETSVGGWQMVLFSVEPGDAAVSFEIMAAGEGAPVSGSVGRAGSMPLGVPVTLRAQDAAGLPRDFESARLSDKQGAFVWWFPGDRTTHIGPDRGLTPEEKQRLKALGYIH